MPAEFWLPHTLLQTAYLMKTAADHPRFCLPLSFGACPFGIVLLSGLEVTGSRGVKVPCRALLLLDMQTPFIAEMQPRG